MPLIALSAKIENAKAIKGMKGQWAKVKKASMQAVPQFWLDKRFPGHFSPGNEARYQMQPRNAFYKNVVKKQEGEGQGKFVSLILKAKSRRWLRTSARITATQNRATLYMQGPPYFANPFIGRMKKEITTKAGLKRTIEINIKRQPDKVAELTRTNDEDRREMTKFLQGELQRRVKEILSGSAP